MVKWFLMQKQVILAAMLLFAVAGAYSSHRPQDFLNNVRGQQDEGRQIAQHFCANCHAAKPLIPVGAPRIGIEADWAPRIKQGIAEMVKHTDEGMNAMPPRGGCFECSDQQLLLAILALLPEKEQKRLNNTLKELN